ncbi:primosome assembly protein PriA [Weissella viridescens]|uniref:Primosome assembly protein PriA n=1 Tax=Weissella viridescens TaxID=1629 RepID=A0A380P7K2_WEIVI|nr:primosome assembly protein PriA [Weissella viridescens]
MFAQIIVDVPTMQTNQPYTYAIPDKFVAVVEAGMRVVVPFGKGSRQVQGFVVGLQDDYHGEVDLKEITDVVDVAPVLNAEMLELADWVARENFAFKISVLQAMLPNVMRAKYVKTVQLRDPALLETDAMLRDFFTDRFEVPLDDNHVTPEVLTALHNMPA